MVKMSFSFRESRNNLNTTVFRVNITHTFKAIRKSLEVPAFCNGFHHFYDWTELGSRDYEIRAVMLHLRHVFPFSSKRLWLPALHERKRRIVFANPRSAQVADGRN